MKRFIPYPCAHRIVRPFRLRPQPAPSRFRIDPDRLIGLTCVLLFPVAIWLA
jgi:hypothetical protein